ncbi:MAG: ATP-dependent zinc metalloprotease FtsH [Alphaproteobacteria bacterium]|nr:ATP-dependent zinc metalloprotease FtsH [Alphaproteobacteria bacterium]
MYNLIFSQPNDPLDGLESRTNEHYSELEFDQSLTKQYSSQSTVRLDSAFWDHLKKGRLEDVEITELNSGLVVSGYMYTKPTYVQQELRKFIFVTREKERLYQELDKSGTRYIEHVPPKPTSENAESSESSGGSIWGLVFPLLSIGFMAFIVWHILGQMRGRSGGMGGFGKSKAKLLTEHTQRVTFEDVAGVEEAKEELMEVVDFLKNPQKYQQVGARMPTGALLIGPPGTGKTLMARAVAGEAGVPFFATSGSEFVEMFVGVGASRVRDMFTEAKKNAPCIIFIDEIDAIGKKRNSGAGMSGGHDEREQTLNQILVEMDGFETDSGVVILAATNRPDTLDEALLRPGRFDRRVQVPNPVLEGREKILAVHMKKIPVSHNVDVKKIARGTPGFSGADLANLVNEAALHTARRDSKIVEMRDFEDAKDKIMMGTKYKTQIMSAEEKEKTAYHEIGHALVGLYSDPPADPLYKVTAIPRGGALGVTINVPEKDQISFSKAQLKSKIAMMFGGRKAEEIIYGRDNITTGAANDIQQATNIAKAMVKEWGFSDKVGRVKYVSQQNNPFGEGGFGDAGVSQETQKLIDDEVKRYIEEAEATAEKILTENRDKLELLTQFLVEREELSGEQVDYILKHKEMPPEPETKPEPTSNDNAKHPVHRIPQVGRPIKGPTPG